MLKIKADSKGLKRVNRPMAAPAKAAWAMPSLKKAIFRKVTKMPR